MSKAVCFLIALVMLLGMGTELNASVKTDACSVSFSDFVVDQIQKNFTQTISAFPEKENQKTDGLIFFCTINQNQQNNFLKNSSNSRSFISANIQFDSSILFYSDIWRHRLRHYGLNEYAINLNSFIAITALNDENKFAPYLLKDWQKCQSFYFGATLC